MNDPLRGALLTILAVQGVLLVALVLTLVVVRLCIEATERSVTRRNDQVRHEILTALLGEPEAATRALAALEAREGRAWARVERLAFTMLPKIKGDSHDALVGLLLRHGAARRAATNASARSLVRRSRGAYQLGALGRAESMPLLLELLSDERFLVRRTAVRALGQVHDPDAVTPLLDAVTADHALVRDVVAALQRIGRGAVPALRHDLGRLVAEQGEGHREGRRGALVATVLGLQGDLGSVPLLVEALEGSHPVLLQVAAAEALGEIGAPAAVSGLVACLGRPSVELRVAAATALGKVSDADAVPAVAAALGVGVHTVDRALASALVGMGPAGIAALESHASPYAREALAMLRLRVPA